MNINIIAHRGDCSRAIENTFESVNNAIEAGIRFIEIDVQLTKDGVPVLFHDRTLQRLCDVNKAVNQLTFAELSKLNFVERKLNGREDNAQRNDNGIVTLREIVELVSKHENITLFVEIKRINFQIFSYRKTLNIVANEVKNIASQVVLISFSYRFLRTVKKQEMALSSPFRLGYVLPSFEQYSAKMIGTLSPDFVFADVDILPVDFVVENKNRTTPNSFNWALYEIGSKRMIQVFAARGFEYFESFKSIELSCSLNNDTA